MENIKIIELFAGIGGIGLGFKKAGFEVVYANDRDKFCKKTYDYNHSPKLHLEDIKNIDIDSIPDFTVLTAGFPCQPFSIVGKQEGFDDKKSGNAFSHILSIIDARKPSVIFLENVKNIRSHDKGNTISVIRQSLSDRGYFFKEAILNSYKHGDTPQHRERLYIVGFKSEEHFNNFYFPDEKPLTKYFKDILIKGVPEKYYHKETGYLFSRIEDGSLEYDTAYIWNRYLQKSNKGICYAITAHMGKGNAPFVKTDKEFVRNLTPRECARLQGYDDDFKFPPDLSDTQLYKQMGNSVTVPVISRIAENIKKAIGA